MKRSTLARAVAAGLAAIAASAASAGPQEDLSVCGAIADSAERLACYDRLAGRPAAPQPAAAAPAAPPAAPAALAPTAPGAVAPPATAAKPATPATTAPAPPATAAKPATPATTAPAPPATAAKPATPAADAGSFGSYSAEHPNAAPGVPQSLNARVTALGKTIDGRPTLTLEGGALWLLDEVDPLLAVGDTVTIRRGLLGSFLLETPTSRLHHVRRIR
jgi:hypothetical protein